MNQEHLHQVLDNLTPDDDLSELPGPFLTSYAVPSILAYTEAEWDHRKRAKSPFSETVEREAVRVM